MDEKNQYPLIIVFYLDKETMQIREIMEPFANHINDILSQKNANAIALFMPTNGEERVECINPKVVAEADMEKINKIIEDIKQNFSVGVDVGVKDEEITPDVKPCDCGKNPDGTCQC